eukprot:1629807-Amphidinium_carterae.2
MPLWQYVLAATEVGMPIGQLGANHKSGEIPRYAPTSVSINNAIHLSRAGSFQHVQPNQITNLE